MSAEDFLPFLERYLAEVPGGTAGDEQMRRRIKVPFMDCTDADVHRDAISDEEMQGWFEYANWNLWELIANRSTEGESGLIPRQQYETVSFVQQWSTYADAFRLITDRIGVDGVIDMGRTPTRELGSKINVTRNWALPFCALLGRGIAISLGLHGPAERRADIEAIIQFGRRLQYGTWGVGCGLVSGRGFRQPLLAEEIVERLLADEQRLSEDEDLHTAFKRFNATTELFGFLLHYDCRAGMCDSGPYPVPGGGFMLVRDHWLHEPAYPWSDVAEGLPYCVTEAMVFRPNEPVDIRINDITTTFAKPTDYHRHLSGIAVYAKDREDTPQSELRLIAAEEMRAIAAKCSQATLELYPRIGERSYEEKIRDGVMVYTTEMMMPHARLAGVWEDIRDSIYQPAPLTEQAWETLSGPKAAEVLAPVFLLGKGFPSLNRVEA
ncbi:MAG TPA: hypothetical protein VHX88_04410 [Solirubrobacteraceae bacterium]|nr:hypothetical protein [Solirubrobacteraceae bacterium]